MERLAATLLCATLVVGPVLLGASQVSKRVSQPAWRGALAFLGIAWLVAAGYPVMRSIAPGAPLAEATLARDGSTTVNVSSPGPYEIDVASEFRGAGSSDLQSHYLVHVKGSGGGEADIGGVFLRTASRVRVGRRGSGVSVSSRTENTHRVEGVAGPRLALSLTALDESIENKVNLSIRSAPLPSIVFFIALGVIALGALATDVRFSDPRHPLRAFALVSFSGAFVFYLNDLATAHVVLRPTIGAAVMAGLVGGAPGLFVGWAARKILSRKIPARS